MRTIRQLLVEICPLFGGLVSRIGVGGQQVRMARFHRVPVKQLPWLALSMLVASADVRPADLETIKGGRLVDDMANDGDSFLVETAREKLRLRLYFVDCPERSASADADAERVQEQMRHFGLTNASQAVRLGEEARRFVAQALSHPFTVYTARAKAPGRFGGRMYAFVTIAGGGDLGEMLVKAGLARPYGETRESPAGVSAKELTQHLQDLEDAAKLGRAGIWAESSPDRILELRQQQREKEAELARVRQESKAGTGTVQAFIDLNTATARELETLPGIGSVLARRIIQGRPYRKVDDLLNVDGIGKKKMDAIRSRIVVHPNQAAPDRNKNSMP